MRYFLTSGELEDLRREHRGLLTLLGSQTDIAAVSNFEDLRLGGLGPNEDDEEACRVEAEQILSDPSVQAVVTELARVDRLRRIRAVGRAMTGSPAIEAAASGIDGHVGQAWGHDALEAEREAIWHLRNAAALIRAADLLADDGS